PLFRNTGWISTLKSPIFLSNLEGPGAFAKTLSAGRDLRGKALERIVTDSDNSTGNTGSSLNYVRPRAAEADNEGEEGIEGRRHRSAGRLLPSRRGWSSF